MPSATAWAAIACVAALTAGGSAALARQASSKAAGPWIGVWRLNPERTAAANGRPRPPAPPAADTIFRMVAARDDVFKYTIETVPRDGAPATVRAELIGRFDGHDYIELGNPGADTNRFRIVDERTYEVVDTKDGRDLVTITIAISADGRTRTSESRGKNAAGEDVHAISVYERVP